MKRIDYTRYNPSWSVVKNAEYLGCSVAAVKKFLQRNDIDRRYDSMYAKWHEIHQYYVQNPLSSYVAARSALGYSINTIKKYKGVSEQELEQSFRDKLSVSSFDVLNVNSIKSVSYNQTEILSWIIRLYMGGKAFDCDLTASICQFWEKLPFPKHLYDKYPQRPDVEDLCLAEYLPDQCFDSVIYDLPYVVSRGKASIIKNRFSYFETPDELYYTNERMMALASRLLRPKGILVVKTMDINAGGVQHWVSDFVWHLALNAGLQPLDKFILLSKSRIFPRTHTQHVARKYHSYFFVFSKPDTKK